MASASRPPEGLTLKQVCAVLDVHARKVQWLRETGTVVPTTVGTGRGTACYYTREDLEKVYIALVVLDGLDYSLRRKIMEGIEHFPHPIREGFMPLSDCAGITIDLERAKREVSKKLEDLT